MGAEVTHEDIKKEVKKATMGLSDVPGKLIGGSLLGGVIGISSGWFQQVGTKWLTQRRSLSMRVSARDREIERFQRDVYDSLVKKQLEGVMKVAEFDSPSGAYDRGAARSISLGLSLPLGGQHLSPFFADMRGNFGKHLMNVTDHAINSFKWPADIVNYATIDLVNPQNGNFRSVANSQLSGAFNSEIADKTLMAKRELLMGTLATMLKNQYFSATAREVIRNSGVITEEKGVKQVQEIIALFENPTSGMVSVLMPELLRVGCSFGDFASVMINETSRAMADSLYASNDGQGHPLYWGLYDYMKEGNDPQKRNTIAQIYQAITSGKAVDFKVVDGKIVGYDRSKAKSFSEAFGCDDNRFEVQDWAIKNKDAIYELLKLDEGKFNKVYKERLEALYLGTFKVTNVNGLINTEEEPSGLSKVFRKALAFNGKVAKENTSIGLPQELLMWQALEDSGIVDDYMKENALTESQVKMINSRRDKIVQTTREMQMARGPQQEYVKFPRDLKSKATSPKFPYIMYGAGEASWEKYYKNPLVMYALVASKWGLSRKFDEEMKRQEVNFDFEYEDDNGVKKNGKTMYELLKRDGDFTEAQEKYIGQQVYDFAQKHPEYKEYIPEVMEIMQSIQGVQLDYAGHQASQYIQHEGIDQLKKAFPEMDKKFTPVNEKRAEAVENLYEKTKNEGNTIAKQVGRVIKKTYNRE